MKQNYYIIRHGKLVRKGNTVYFLCRKEENDKPEFIMEVDGEEIKDQPEDASDHTAYARYILPIEQIGSIFLYGRVSMTSGVISYLAKRNIPVHFFGYYGNYECSLMPKDFLLSGKLHIEQARHYLEEDKRLYIARRIVEGSALNMIRNLENYSNEGVDLNREISLIRSTLQSCYNCSRVSELLAIEGNIRSAYYSTFPKILKHRMDWEGRIRQPPSNPLNAMLSFGNSLLYAITINQIYHTQLDQTISFLHEPSERRFSLALDISEIFKPFLVDRIIFKLVNKGMISDSHFVKDLDGCLLNRKGKEVFLNEFHNKLKTTIKHRSLGRKISYERLIYLECLKLIKHFIQMKEYKPFVIWW